MGQRKFQNGELVEWESQSQGVRTKKQGMAYYIAPGADPFDALRSSWPDCPPAICMFDGLPRPRGSYIVIVDRGPGKAHGAYWPRVCHLRKVSQ